MIGEHAEALATVHHHSLSGQEEPSFAFIYNAPDLSHLSVDALHGEAVRRGALPDMTVQRAFDAGSHGVHTTRQPRSIARTLEAARLANAGKAMNPREFVDTRMKRCMAQTLEQFEVEIEEPLRELHSLLSNGSTARRLGRVIDDVDGVKRTFRKRLQAFAADCADVMPSDVEINAFEPIRR